MNAKTKGTIRVGDYELGYRVEGKGRPALVIGSSIYYPRTFSRNLRQHLKLVFADHRGFARTRHEIVPADYTLDVILDDIERIRAHLGLNKVVIIGHSAHGYMALEYARKYPGHVSHVILIATGPDHSATTEALKERHWKEAVCPARKAQLERDLALLPTELEADPERRFITFCIRLGARSWFDPAFDAAPLWKDVHVNMPVIDHLWGEAFREIDMGCSLDALRAPLFLALGRFDYLVAPHFAWDAYRDRCNDLTVRVFDRSGHTPQLEESDQFDAELLHWLDRTGL